MPRRAKGPRLYLDPKERVFVIRDGTRKRRTGCGEGERERAEIALRDYIAAKYEPVSDHRPDRVLVADVLTYYNREIAPSQKAAASTGYAVDRLLEWWNTKPLSVVKRSTCAAYVSHRTSQPIPQARTGIARARKVTVETARRELGVLRAAINAYHAENALDAVPIVTLPPAAPPRDRWLTRGEAAAFLRAARMHPERPARNALIRFTLIALYTGTRSAAIRTIAWMPTTTGGWIDLEAGVMYRKAAGVRPSRKLQPPLRVPTRLLGHLRRWRQLDGPKAVHVIRQGATAGLYQRRTWAWVRGKAGLGAEVVPHILRHTAATWMMQQGTSIWDAAGYLGMSPEILWRVYGHHHPDWQHDIANRVGRRRTAILSKRTETP